MDRRNTLRTALAFDLALVPLLMLLSFYFTEQTIAEPPATYTSEFGELITFSFAEQPGFQRALFGLYVVGSLALAATIVYSVALVNTKRFPVVLFTIKTTLLGFAALCVSDALPLEALLAFVAFSIGTYVLFAVVLFSQSRERPQALPVLGSFDLVQ